MWDRANVKLLKGYKRSPTEYKRLVNDIQRWKKQ